jgi:hypothetical protein
MGIYQSSGRTRNPLGVVSVLFGGVGAAASLILWAYQYAPHSSLVSSVAAKLGPGFALGDGLVTIGLVCGALAIALAIAGALGGRLRGSAAIAMVLGVIAISYPLLSKLQVVARPLIHRFP